MGRSGGRRRQLIVRIGPFRLPVLVSSRPRKPIWLRRLASPRRLLLILVGIVVLSLLIGKVVSCAAFNQRVAKAEYDAKSNLHAIQLAIERYAVDSGGYYPEDIRELVDRGYLAEFPQNPYAGVLADFPSLEKARPMRPLRLGEQAPGDFVYVPERTLVERDGTLTFVGRVESYILVLSPNANRKYWGRRPNLPPNILEPAWKPRYATVEDPDEIRWSRRGRIISAYRFPSTWR